MPSYPTIATPTRLAGPVAVATADGEKIVYTEAGTFGSIIKSVRISTGNATPQTCSWGILPSGQTPGTGARFLLQDLPLQDGDPVTDDVTQKLNSGDRIIVVAADATVTITGLALS